MEGTICSECGQELQIGDFPFCGKDGTHESIYPQFAQNFTPVVVHRDAQGNVRFPGHANSPVPEGFQKVELTTVHEIRKFEREMNVKEKDRAETNRHMQRENSQAEHKQRREFMKEAIRRMTPRGRKFAEMVMAGKDQHRGRLDRPTGDPNFHVDAFSQTQSNREQYCDRETGWKGRRE